MLTWRKFDARVPLICVGGDEILVGGDVPAGLLMKRLGFGAMVGLGGTAGGTVDRFGDVALYKGFLRPRMPPLTSASASSCW